MYGGDSPLRNTCAGWENSFMKSMEEHIDDYLDKYNELSKKGELWRIRSTPQVFIKEVERIKKYERDSREHGYFTEAAIQSQVKSMLAVILMNKVKYEEAKEQCERSKEAAAQQFLKEAPQKQEYVKHIKVPLEFKDVRAIFSGLMRNQITLEMIPIHVFEEFKKTRQYKMFSREKPGK